MLWPRVMAGTKDSVSYSLRVEDHTPMSEERAYREKAEVVSHIPNLGFSGLIVANLLGRMVSTIRPINT